MYRIYIGRVVSGTLRNWHLTYLSLSKTALSALLVIKFNLLWILSWTALNLTQRCPGLHSALDKHCPWTALSLVKFQISHNPNKEKQCHEHFCLTVRNSRHFRIENKHFQRNYKPKKCIIVSYYLYCLVSKLSYHFKQTRNKQFVFNVWLFV